MPRSLRVPAALALALLVCAACNEAGNRGDISSMSTTPINPPDQDIAPLPLPRPGDGRLPETADDLQGNGDVQFDQSSEENAAGLSASKAAYVALGDSYSAGVGAGRLTGDWCKQATKQAWPQLIANQLKAAGALPGGNYTHAACSGYTIPDVAFKQLDSLSEDAKWVSITIGGNDVGFAATLRACVDFNRKQCFQALDKATYLIQGLAGPLAELYVTIAQKAKNATIFVAGYPDIVPNKFWWECLEGVLDKDERESLRAQVRPLNEQIQKAISIATGRIGPRIVFVDVEGAFKGHEPCSKNEYVTAINVTDIGASYHPNAAGQLAYATQVWSAMNNTLALPLPSVDAQAIPEFS